MTKEVLVVGGGVIGITTTRELLNAGIPVKLFTSNAQIAGRNGVGILERQGEDITVVRNGQQVESFNSVDWENQSFAKFKKWLDEKRSWVNLMPVTYHRVKPSGDAFVDPFPGMEARELEVTEVLPPFVCGYTFNGYIINTRSYYDFLYEQVVSHRLFRGIESGEISSPDEVDHPCSIIACGLGQRAWDSQVFPGLGETVIVDAPDVRRDRVVGGILPEYSANVVPIPGAASQVLVGASKRDGLDYESPRDEWFSRILKEGINVVPELANSTVIDTRVGCRPKRHGGVRLEVTETEKRLQIIAGGFGGAGWTLSHGCASKLLEFVSR